MDDLPTATPSRRKRKGKASDNLENNVVSNIIVQTSFDAYFTYTSARPQTSTNVFSHLVLPLSTEEYADAIENMKGPKHIEPRLISESSRMTLFSRFLCELNEGFNILCYGFGSKRRVLNQFAVDYCAKAGHVVVCNGFQPDFSMKDLLNSIENVPGIQALELSSTTIEKQTQRIYDYFAQSTQKRHLYIIIHNVDAAPIRTLKAKSLLSLLALNPRIHIIASIDHINAPLLWSTSEASTRKPAAQESIPTRGFAWLWHDLTTLASYDFELAFTDKSSISGAHGGGARRKTDTMLAQNATAMSETAALHILASVTQKAKKLFALLGAKQLESIEDAGEGVAVNDLQQFGLGYDILFNAARDNFVATNDTALRSLLGEFRDHGLVLSAQGASSGGEILWIPLRKERLSSVIKSIQSEQ
ncbi:origin recognition complex, subunit 2 [Crucibulum laeve]|uniref:Origin recognition complex subunit 2 n=1 Tax=Crucibulum laeve TaxID=68775 RepID=A0A5C3M8P8_9AGAR|nr:origin recognition complex, subunit 2 [Crucibulum laeve]